MLEGFWKQEVSRTHYLNNEIEKMIMMMNKMMSSKNIVLRVQRFEEHGFSNSKARSSSGAFAFCLDVNSDIILLQVCLLITSP